MIKVCEFDARDIKGNHKAYIEVEKYNGFYYYIAFNGSRSQEYRSLAEAKEDIHSLYKGYNGYKLLI